MFIINSSGLSLVTEQLNSLTELSFTGVAPEVVITIGRKNFFVA